MVSKLNLYFADCLSASFEKLFCMQNSFVSRQNNVIASLQTGCAWSCKLICILRKELFNEL